MPYDERNNETGKFTPEFTDGQFIDAIREKGDATTTEVADAVGCKYRTAHQRLTDLEEGGIVTFREVGNARLWTVNDS